MQNRRSGHQNWQSGRQQSAAYQNQYWHQQAYSQPANQYRQYQEAYAQPAQQAYVQPTHYEYQHELVVQEADFQQDTYGHPAYYQYEHMSVHPAYEGDAYPQMANMHSFEQGGHDNWHNWQGNQHGYWPTGEQGMYGRENANTRPVNVRSANVRPANVHPVNQGQRRSDWDQLPPCWNHQNCNGRVTSGFIGPGNDSWCGDCRNRCVEIVRHIERVQRPGDRDRCYCGIWACHQCLLLENMGLKMVGDPCQSPKETCARRHLHQSCAAQSNEQAVQTEPSDNVSSFEVHNVGAQSGEEVEALSSSVSSPTSSSPTQSDSPTVQPATPQVAVSPLTLRRGRRSSEKLRRVKSTPR